jgi:hypothetical protein
MNFSRQDYERIIELARELDRPGVTAVKRKKIATELFNMAENVIGQQQYPLRSA